MLELLKDWAMALAGIIVFGSVCEVILPGGVFQKYVRLAVGLMLILALTAPITKLLGVDIQADFFQEEQAKAYQQRAAMETRQKAEVMRVYKKNLCQKLAMTLQGIFDEEEFEVRCEVEEKNEENFGEIQQVLVLVQAGTADKTTAAVEALKNQYGIEKSKIEVRYLMHRSG